MNQRGNGNHSGEHCEFSLAHYRQLLHRLRDRGLEFISFGTFLQQGSKDNGYVLLRHDVDVSLQPARELWQMEAELGVHSTWFFRTRATGYSLDQPKYGQWISELVASGSEVALHEEVSHSAFSPAELVVALTQERLRLEDVIGMPVLGVSTHVPRLARITLTEELAQQAGFQYEAGSAKFNPPGITFFSDANRSWKSLKQGCPRTAGCPCKMEIAPIYLITHPIWWSKLEHQVSEIVEYLVAGK